MSKLMKFTVRVVFEWDDVFTKQDAADVSNYVYAPKYPPPETWPKLLEQWLRETRHVPDEATMKVRIVSQVKGGDV